MLTFDSNLSIKNFLSSIDYFVLIVIFVLHALVVLYSRIKPRNTRLLIETKMALPVFVSSLTVAWYGKFFYVTQTAFDNGLYNFYTQGIFWYIAYMLFAFYLIKKIRRYNAVSLTDLISKIYGDKSTNIVVTLVIIKALPVTYLLGLVMVIHMFMNISIWTIALLILAWLIVKSMNYDIRGEAYSNVIHFTCVISSVGIVLMFAVIKLGGFNFLYANLPITYFQPRGVHSIINMLSWLVLAVSTTFISPIFYQYCLAAKSDRTAKTGIIICTAFWILIDICTTAGAMYAKVIFSDAKPLLAYGMLVSNILPNGVRGLFVAGIMGTIIPSISACLSIIMQAIYYDLITIKHHSKINTLGIIVSIILIITVLFNDLFESILSVKNCFAGLLFIPVMIGLYAPRLITGGSIFFSVIISGMAMGIWYLFRMQEIIKADLVVVGSITSIIVFICNYYLVNTNELFSGVLRKLK